MRSGRFVIPVKADNRGDIKGLVHDTSNTGSTLFVVVGGARLALAAQFRGPGLNKRGGFCV